ncbi:hypothetical protein LJR219_005149 [Phenylobacterium sp. LjRoot219]|uniref:hypothetical protein n=1 Tax=Phenylobacterium sp. LjRoot219 TaxID=3342283 RepID=UPI003ED0652E
MSGPPLAPEAPTYRGPVLNDWNTTLLATQEVIVRRLGLLTQADGSARAELQLAVSEKLEFCARWSWLLAAGGWLKLDNAFVQMSSEAMAKIRENRDRLASDHRPVADYNTAAPGLTSDLG